MKSINPSDLPSTIRQAVEGNFYYVARPEEPDTEAVLRDAGLTDKQAQILKAVARGLSNEAIGRELWLSEQTVKFHLHKVYRKLGLSNRTEAARWAYEHGLVEYAH